MNNHSNVLLPGVLSVEFLVLEEYVYGERENSVIFVLEKVITIFSYKKKLNGKQNGGKIPIYGL